MVCTKCGKDKAPQEFNFRNKAAGKRLKRCRDCQKKWRKKHYQDNREALIKKQGGINRNTIKRNRERAYAWLKSHPCVDCGEPDPIVLEFDHLDPVMKRMAVSEMVSQCYSWESIQEEIEKCEVRCANCHRRRTAQERGYYAFLKVAG